MEKITQRNGRRKSMTESHYFCMGCGATIQTENHEEIGYTPTSVLTKMLEKEEPVYCQRCFRLRNYNELQPASLNPLCSGFSPGKTYGTPNCSATLSIRFLRLLDTKIISIWFSFNC